MTTIQYFSLWSTFCFTRQIKRFDDNLSNQIVPRFSFHIQEKDEMDLRPVFTEDGVTYVYIKVCQLRMFSHSIVICVWRLEYIVLMECVATHFTSKDSCHYCFRLAVHLLFYFLRFKRFKWLKIFTVSNSHVLNIEVKCWHYRLHSISVQQSPSVGGNEEELKYSADTVFPLPSHNCKFFVSWLFCISRLTCRTKYW